MDRSWSGVPNRRGRRLPGPYPRPMVVRTGVAAVIVALFSVSLNAQQSDVRTQSLNPAIPTPQKLIIRSEDLFPLTHPTRLGMFTLVPPETNGEVIRVAIPVGELASRAARAVSDARHRRAERKVDERIARELQQLFVPDAVTFRPTDQRR
jgi:hypothetical protein